MRELSLFTGAGGGIYGSKILGWRTIGYVEADKECQKILEQRIKDGIFDTAPRFGDIKKFISEGFASGYESLVDIITAGFPCQPFSVAGKRLAESDSRNMWPSTIECIRIIRPKYALLENVPGLVAHPYFGTILGELAEAGYRYRWACLGADDVGANHRRKRLWILAYAVNRRPQVRRSEGEQSNVWKNENVGSEVTEFCPAVNVSHPNSPGRGEQRESEPDGAEHVTTECGGEEVADTERMRELQSQGGKQDERRRVGNGSSENIPKSKLNGLEKQRDGRISERPTDTVTDSGWWSVEPNVGRVAHGVANRCNRIRMLGNGQVPLQMAYAYAKLSEGIVE